MHLQQPTTIRGCDSKTSVAPPQVSQLVSQAKNELEHILTPYCDTATLTIAPKDLNENPCPPFWTPRAAKISWGKC